MMQSTSLERRLVASRDQYPTDRRRTDSGGVGGGRREKKNAVPIRDVERRSSFGSGLGESREWDAPVVSVEADVEVGVDVPLGAVSVLAEHVAAIVVQRLVVAHKVVQRRACNTT